MTYANCIEWETFAISKTGLNHGEERSWMHRILRFTACVGLVYALCFSSGASAASLFAVEHGAPAIDAGPLVIAPNTPTSIDIYVDAGDTNDWGFAVNLYLNRGTLENIVDGSEAIGNWQEVDYWYQVNDNCGGQCSSQIVLVVSADVTLSDGGDLTGDGWALIDPGDIQAILVTTLVPEPSQTPLMLACLGTIMMIAQLRTKRVGL